MKIKIWRGQNQIGGSIIEVASDTTRVILDIGSNLDEKDKNECGFYHISDIIEVIPNPKDEFTCEEIEGYQVEELKRILEFKKKRNAPKDQPYIEKITKYLEEHKN